MMFRISSRLNAGNFQTAFTLLQNTHWGQHIDKKKFKLQNKNTNTYGIFSGKEMIGFFRILTDGAFVCYLMDLVIDPVFRQQGAASMALAYIEEKHKKFKIILRSSEAQKLYLAKGFKPIHKTDNYFIKVN